jgi:hypothetical protein
MIQQEAIRYFNLKGLTFDLIQLRLHFVARGPVRFPVGMPANILRGGFGITLKRIASSEIYSRIFEPKLPGGPSGLADPPRPFVFRARHLDGRLIAPGEGFHFDVNILDVRDDAVSCFTKVFSELARQGLGPTRGRAELTGADGILQCLRLEPAPDLVAGSALNF